MPAKINAPVPHSIPTGCCVSLKNHVAESFTHSTQNGMLCDISEWGLFVKVSGGAVPVISAGSCVPFGCVRPT